MSIDTPWIIDSHQLEQQLNDQNLLVVDMTKRDNYLQAHIPGAVFMDYANIVKHAPPIVGMLPDPEIFSQTLSSLGITPDTYVVPYDEEGGGKAARLMWTLEIAGHKKMSLLNGGIHAWIRDKKPLDVDIPKITPSHYPVSFENRSPVADADYIKAHLNNVDFCVLDTRSKNEYIGVDKRAARAGHIPGAINLDWLDIKRAEDAQCLKSPKELEDMLTELGLSPDKEVVTHCQSHHRSALMYVALKALGFKHVKGYPASWSDWASRNDTPVEI